ncbi:hypothetical protein IBX65_08285 [Candidatus Aerophobetes bacterium]|nr:hypothetical protein [Candidatus Aerophobetes bacterium]
MFACARRNNGAGLAKTRIGVISAGGMERGFVVVVYSYCGYWRQILSSLVVCFFARGIYSTERVLETLHFAGFELNHNDLGRMGKSIHQEKYRFKLREGFSPHGMRFPERILETLSPAGQLDKEFINEVLAQFARTVLEAKA